MTEASTLIQKQDFINKEIYEFAKARNELHEPITDGVVNEELYLAAKPKMLWILKDPWEKLEKGESGGGWSLVKDLLKDGWDSNKGTYALMAYVSYSILNGFKEYKDIPYVSNDTAVGTSLKNIAYINIKKFPGATQSDPAEIAEYYKAYRSFLLRQIETINPEVVIGGSTLPLFYEDLDLSIDSFDHVTPTAWSAPKGSRLFVHAYHPNQRSVSHATYVDDIVLAVKKGLKTL